MRVGLRGPGLIELRGSELNGSVEILREAILERGGCSMVDVGLLICERRPPGPPIDGRGVLMPRGPRGGRDRVGEKRGEKTFLGGPSPPLTSSSDDA